MSVGWVSQTGASSGTSTTGSSAARMTGLLSQEESRFQIVIRPCTLILAGKYHTVRRLLGADGLTRKFFQPKLQLASLCVFSSLAAGWVLFVFLLLRCLPVVGVRRQGET